MFTISIDKEIHYYGDAEQPDDDQFETEAGLLKLAEAKSWSKEYITSIWNNFAGVVPFDDLKPVKQFRNRPYGVARIWEAIQRLKGAAAHAEPVAEAEVSSERKNGFREGSKAAEALRLMRRANGVSGSELQEKMGWLPHTVRGFISTLQSKRGITVTSEAHQTRGRVYRAS